MNAIAGIEDIAMEVVPVVARNERRGRVGTNVGKGGRGKKVQLEKRIGAGRRINPGRSSNRRD